MNLVLVALVGLASVQDADAERIGKLVQDLGAADFSVRKEADAELRRIGKPAIPALKEAVKDPDPERAMRARLILQDLETESPKLTPQGEPPQTGTRVSVRVQDGEKDVAFDLHPDGRVEVKVRETDEKGSTVERTYKADSMEAFKKKYPDVARKYDLEQYLPRVRAFGRLPQPGFRRGLPPEFKRLEEFFRDFEKRFEGRPQPFRFRWAIPGPGQEPGQGRLPTPSEPKGPELGVLISPVDPVLADQLALPDGRGFTLTEVKPESNAARAGLKRFDVLIELEGEPVTDLDAFGASVRKRLADGKPFDLTVIRRGERRKIRVTPLQ